MAMKWEGRGEKVYRVENFATTAFLMKPRGSSLFFPREMLGKCSVRVCLL